MIRRIAITLWIALASVATYAAGYSFTVGGLRCTTIARGVVEVANGRDSLNYVAGDFAIPATVTHNDSVYTVAGIAPQGFSGCYRLRHIELPTTLRYIGGNAFEGCLSLQELTIPEGVELIGGNITKECNMLRKITYKARNAGRFGSIYEPTPYGNCPIDTVVISATVEHLPRGFMAHFGNVKEVTVPASVTTIGEGAFAACRALERIDVEEGNRRYRSIEGVLCSINGDTLVALPETLGGATYTLPAGITAIAPQAFSGNTTMRRINLNNDTLRTIGRSAFYRSAIETVAIPATVERIAPLAFAACGNLMEITVDKRNKSYAAIDGVLVGRRWASIEAYPGGRKGGYITPRGIKGVGIGAFAFSRIDTLTVGEGVIEIANSAFFECGGLQSVRLPSTLQYIDKESFAGCRSLASLRLPAAIKRIDRMAFAFCTALRDMTIDATTPPQLGEGAFWQVSDCALHAPSEAYADPLLQWSKIFNITVDENNN